MFDDNKKENRRKHLNINKKKDSFKKRIRYEDEEYTPKKKSHKNSLRDTRADELWEEWENTNED